MQYRQEIIRDAFTNGLKSPGIQQRHRELNFEIAVEKDCAMELAQKICEYYSQSQDIIRLSLSAATLQKKKSETKDPDCEIIAAQPPPTFHVASKTSSKACKTACISPTSGLRDVKEISFDEIGFCCYL